MHILTLLIIAQLLGLSLSVQQAGATQHAPPTATASSQSTPATPQVSGTPPQRDPFKSEAAQPPLFGSYVGQITESSKRTIPLAIILATSRKMIHPDRIDAGMQAITEELGSILIDEEAGPYTFSSVYVDLVSTEVDLRYSRTDSNGVRVTLFFIGHLGASGKLSGDVISSLRGKLGTFVVTRVGDETRLPSLTNHTVGTWTGSLRRSSGLSDLGLTVVLSSGNSVQANPDNLELGFTPGRLGSATINNFSLSLTSVVIDYLSQDATLSATDGSSGVVFVLRGKLSKDSFDGSCSSSLKGTIGSFHLLRKTETTAKVETHALPTKPAIAETSFAQGRR